MISNRALVYLVDDDPVISFSLSRLIQAEDMLVETFSSPTEFLFHAGETGLETGRRSCLLLDVFMPEITGLEVQARLKTLGESIPIIFISSHADIPMSVQAMKAGAVDFLEKPFDEKKLMSSIRSALEISLVWMEERLMRHEMRLKVESLTPREKIVMQYVVTGLLNKQIADALDIAEGTIKIHRGRIMSKMGVQSIADLVRATQLAGIEPARVD